LVDWFVGWLVGWLVGWCTPVTLIIQPDSDLSYRFVYER